MNNLSAISVDHKRVSSFNILMEAEAFYEHKICHDGRWQKKIFQSSIKVFILLESREWRMSALSIRHLLKVETNECEAKQPRLIQFPYKIVGLEE